MAQKERARRYTSLSEMKQARGERLNFEAPIPLSQLPDLIGDYLLSRKEFIRCQLVDKHGMCRKEHGRGYIAQLADGTEGCIGHVCVADHFETDPRFKEFFATQTARVDREIETDRLVERLNVHLGNEALPAALGRIERKRSALFDEVADIRNTLPPNIYHLLSKRAQRNESAVRVSIIYKERVEDERTKEVREVPRPVETVWRSFTGLSGIKEQPLRSLGKRLADASSALSDATASPDQPIESLQRWVGQLDYVTRADRELDLIRAAIDSFRRLENLKWLWLLTRPRLEQIATARASLELATRKRASDEQAIKALDAWAAEIRDAHNGLDFRVL